MTLSISRQWSGSAFVLLTLVLPVRPARAQAARRTGLQAPPSGVSQPAAQPPSTLGLPPRPGAAWWKDEAFKRDLGLNNDQSARMDAIFQATLPQLRQGYDELDRLESKLSHLIEAGTDEARVIKEIDRVEATRGDLNKTRTLMHMHMRQVLTPEQRVRCTALCERRQQEQQRQQPGRRPGLSPDVQGLED